MIKIKTGDLFAGIGGIALGLKRAGFDIVWANEYDPKACITYRSNFSHKLIEEDIKKINPDTLEKVDLLAGGFPCQAFSIAGYRKGFSDDRGNLFFDILRFIDSHSPKIIFLENVKNLKSHNCGKTFERMLQELNIRGYYTKYKILNTCEYSEVPQNRERIYIISFKNKKVYDAFEFPEKIETSKSIHDIIEDSAPKEFYYINTKYYSQLKREMLNINTVYQWRRKYLRENKSGLCPTLTANMGTGGHNVPLIRDKKDIRKLTPRECAKFQGFDDNFILPKELPNSTLYKQIGNSVSVPVVYRLALNIRQALESCSKTKDKSYPQSQKQMGS